MEALELLKARLGIISSARDIYLQAIINAVKSEMTNTHGLAIDETSPEVLMFIVDYACYRYLNKGEDSGMPRHLQWRLHNLIIGGVKNV